MFLSGLLDFLASDCSAAKELLRRYVFFVVPVLNPDGAPLGRGASRGKREMKRNMKIMKSEYLHD